jgi:hypothetical protein
MTHAASTDKRRFRFGVRSLLYAVAALALLLTFGQRVYQWYYAIPRVLVAEAVAKFNARFAHDAVGKHEPQITESEIVAAIRSQIPSLPASDAVKAIFSEITNTGLLPHDASLDAMSGWTLKDGTNYTVWWINLDVKTGEGSGFSLRIRENNEPVAKPITEPKLERKNVSWILQSSSWIVERTPT